MNSSDNSINILRETGFSLLDEGKTLRIRAEGFSMFPSIEPGSVILIEPFFPTRGPEKGEIIAWKRNSGFVVHRLVGMTERGNERLFITRGDSAGRDDLPVSAGQLAGRVIAIEDPAGRTISPVSHIPSNFTYLWNRFMAWFVLRKTVILKTFQKK